MLTEIEKIRIMDLYEAEVKPARIAEKLKLCTKQVSAFLHTKNGKSRTALALKDMLEKFKPVIYRGCEIKAENPFNTVTKFYIYKDGELKNKLPLPTLASAKTFVDYHIPHPMPKANLKSLGYENSMSIIYRIKKEHHDRHKIPDIYKNPKHTSEYFNKQFT